MTAEADRLDDRLSVGDLWGGFEGSDPDLMAAGWLPPGPRVAAFEAAFAAAQGVTNGVAASNCMTALHLALLVAGVRPGDEVVVPSLSFATTAHAPRHVGADPVFADVDPQTGNVTASTIAAVLGPRTRAVVVADHGGLPVDIGPIAELCEDHGIALVEDASFAVGSRYRGHPVGVGADVTAWSFLPRRALRTGEGGLLTTDCLASAQQARRLRQHSDLGFTFRMTDIQAAIGLVQLRRLPAMVARRRALATVYREALEGVPGLRLVEDPREGESNYQSFWAEIGDEFPLSRDELRGALAAEGIPVGTGVRAAHREPDFADCPLRVPLPATERLSARTLTFPLDHELGESGVLRVCDAIRRTRVHGCGQQTEEARGGIPT
ncbi:DegT/DnrJ/EryC1/StrS family aminotransferase [Sinomonas sp. JGH33]|uniref:DegT/DnrJ/EryC1/StrS family aminotransferase n=1 Tax=Sinomonas terricola TaxID=3110330 RepID=A0ABU5TC86_9MICC|nr:DegT/DnrJ/EryC1/StrS family aminotransferase [Sinomonas sp. JGH33]MEA5456681.1 DegT/DnrJ/EryC1/StrS family aminotransferase [Sinomonas sp. JGH33]